MLSQKALSKRKPYIAVLLEVADYPMYLQYKCETCDKSGIVFRDIEIIGITR